MLTALNAAQLVLYIALLALAGQGLLFLLLGAKRGRNVFYQVLQVLSKPFTRLLRLLTPKVVGDAQVPLVTFFALLALYAAVTLERANLCVTGQLLGQAGCR